MAHWTDYLQPDQADGAYLSWKQVQPRVGISRTTAWRLQKAGDFPRPYAVSRGRVAYKEREVEAWKKSRGHRGEAPAGRTEAQRSEWIPPEPPTSRPGDRSPPGQPVREPDKRVRAAVRPKACRPKAAPAQDRQITFDF